MADNSPSEREGATRARSPGPAPSRRHPGRGDGRERRLQLPRPSSAHVSRERLQQRLNKGTHRKLTLLSAPAGCGKTSLIAWWAASQPTSRRVAWLQVDHHHNDRRHFWSDVVAAFSGALGGNALDELAVPAGGSSVGFLSRLEQRIASTGQPVTLVLDDLQEIDRPSLLRDLGQFIRSAPVALNVVISTRVDPDIGLERLRLDGECVEIRMRDLAFTRAETQRLIKQERIELTNVHTRLLWEKTQGWIGALQLAATSLIDHPAPGEFVTQFAGSEAPVSDYLSKEVLARQSPAARNFLLRVSVARDLSTELANAITGLSNGRGMLRSLASRNALVSLVDRGWYQIHPLFREYLLAELAYRFPREVANLHRRAAVWLDENGHVRDAVEHAIVARDWSMAAELLKRQWLNLLIEGRLAELSHLVGALPKSMFDDDPELAIACSATFFENGDIGKSRRYFRRVNDIRPQDFPSDRLAIALPAATLYSSRLEGNLQGAAEAAQELIDVLHGGSNVDAIEAGDLRAFAWVNLGAAEIWAGQFIEAEDHLERAAGQAETNELDYMSLLSEAHLSFLHIVLGHLRHGEERAAKALDMARRNGWQETAPAILAFCVSGLIHHEWGELKAAQRFVDPIELPQRSIKDQPLRALVGMSRGLIQLSSGRFESALEQFAGARRDIREWPAFWQFDATLLSVEARALAALGEGSRARKRLEDAMGATDSIEIRTTLARLHFDAGRLDEALQVLVTLGGDGVAAEDIPLVGSYAKALEAFARFRMDDVAGARAACEAALDLAEPEGVRMPFLEHGESIRVLLEEQLSGSTSHRAFLRNLIGTLDERMTSEGTRQYLVEPLTEREEVVLSYLPSRLSYAEIAEEIFVSVNTVKTHVKNIYRKLSVERRRDAVDRALELDLLPSAAGSGPLGGQFLIEPIAH